MGSIDDLLAQIESEYQQKGKICPPEGLASPSPPQPAKTPKNKSLEQALEELDAEFNQKKKSNTPKRQKSSSSVDNFFSQIQTDFVQNNDKSSSSVSHQETIEAIKGQELEQQRKLKTITRQAQQWLNNLDPNSDEGFWFEQFAYSYDSKLTAAIEYLQALQAVTQKPI